MPPSWRLPDHPQLAQSVMEMHAGVQRWRTRPGEAVFHTLAATALAVLSLAAINTANERIQQGLAWAVEHPLPTGVLLWAAAWWRLHRSATAFLQQTREMGWLAALPVSEALHRHGMRQRLAVEAGMLAGAVVALLATLAVVLPQAGSQLALTAVLSLGALCAALLVASALPRSDIARGRTAASPTTVTASEARGWHRPPWWATPWPELVQLQRRCAQRAWRGGRAWVWLLPLGLLVLAGEGPRVLAGMLILVALLPWLRTVQDASARGLAEAERLLLATPRSRADICSSGWRYPALRVALATLGFAGAVALFGASPWWIALAAFGFLSIGLLEIGLMLHYPRSRARQRGQLMAEIALLLVLAREGLGPGVLLIAMALAGWHAWRARRLP